jgi:4-hydroxy-2-oxoheptanedioate aldolase
MSAALKKQVLAKDVISVCNADFPTPAMVEFIGELGFDVLFVDCEQSSTDFALVEELGRAARLVNMATVLRPWSNEAGLLNRYLSCGMGGIQAAHIRNVAEAEAIIEGVRHWDKGDYRDKIFVLMVETKEAVDNLPALLKLDGFDVFYIGQNDLAESMGLKGDRKNPKIRSLVEDSIKRVADAGKIAGMNVQDEIDEVRRYMDIGLRWINVHQKQFMARGSKAFLNSIKPKAAS